jgi:hypothetical protein
VKEGGSAGKLELISARAFEPYDQMYRVVDFLNKSLKNRDLVFGLSKDEDGKMVVAIYKT